MVTFSIPFIIPVMASDVDHFRMWRLRMLRATINHVDMSRHFQTVKYTTICPRPRPIPKTHLSTSNTSRFIIKAYLFLQGAPNQVLVLMEEKWHWAYVVRFHNSVYCYNVHQETTNAKM